MGRNHFFSLFYDKSKNILIEVLLFNFNLLQQQQQQQEKQQQTTNKKNFFFNFQIFENLTTTTTLTLIFIDFLITYKLIKLESLKDEEISFLFHFY